MSDSVDSLSCEWLPLRHSSYLATPLPSSISWTIPLLLSNESTREILERSSVSSTSSSSMRLSGPSAPRSAFTTKIRLEVGFTPPLSNTSSGDIILFTFFTLRIIKFLPEKICAESKVRYRHKGDRPTTGWVQGVSSKPLHPER